MSLRTDLQRFLIGQADIRRHAGDRVFWQLAPPRTATPLVTYNLVSQPPEGVSLSGEHNLRTQIWQFDVWAEQRDDPTGEKLEFTAAAIEAALLDYAGPIGDVTVRTIDRVTGGEGHQIPRDGDESATNRITHEFEISFEA